MPTFCFCPSLKQKKYFNIILAAEAAAPVVVVVIAVKSLAWPTSRCILFDGENTPFDASLVIYIYK
jgi:hypothetical protein